MSAVEPSLDELLEEKKRVRNPLVPVGIFPFSLLFCFLLICFYMGLYVYV